MEKSYTLDRKIVLQTKSVTRGDAGGVNDGYADMASVWADIFYKSGGEKFEAGKNTATNIVIFTIRYKTWPNEITRVKYGSKTYDVTHINEYGRKHYLQLTCETKY